ncbi:hypothetical protein J1N35_014542, partial [Gossypium stocksii]
SRKSNVHETLVASNPSKFLNANMEKIFLELRGKTFIQERGFEPSMVFCKEIRPLVQYHRWEHFCVTPNKNVVLPIIQEFYVALRDQKARRPYKAIWEIVTIR